MTRLLTMPLIAFAACTAVVPLACSDSETPTRREMANSNAGAANPGFSVGGTMPPPSITPGRRASGGSGGGTSSQTGGPLDAGLAGLSGAGHDSLSAGGVGSDGGAGPPRPVTDGDFAVLCEDGNGGQLETPQFSIKLYLVNKSAHDLTLSDLTVRYFFTADQASAIGHNVFIDHAGVFLGGSSNVTGKAFALTPEHEKADTYVELSFGGGHCQGAPCVLPAVNEGEPDLNASEIKLRVQIDPTSLRYKLDNDYSYSAEVSPGVPCSRLVMYDRGQILFGVQPDGHTAPEPPSVTDDAGTVDAGADTDGLDAAVPPTDQGNDAAAEPGLVDDAGPSEDASTLQDASLSPAALAR